MLTIFDSAISGLSAHHDWLWNCGGCLGDALVEPWNNPARPTPYFDTGKAFY